MEKRFSELACNVMLFIFFVNMNETKKVIAFETLKMSLHDSRSLIALKHEGCESKQSFFQNDLIIFRYSY